MSILFSKSPEWDIADQQRIVQSELKRYQAELKLSDTARLHPDIAVLVDLIHDHLFEEDLSFKKLQAMSGLRNNNVSSYFKLYVGVGVREYIEERRMEVALRILKHEKLPLLAVSMAIGYSYPESFYRAFKRRMGCSPSQYRDEMLRTQPKEEVLRLKDKKNA